MSDNEAMDNSNSSMGNADIDAEDSSPVPPGTLFVDPGDFDNEDLSNKPRRNGMYQFNFEDTAKDVGGLPNDNNEDDIEDSLLFDDPTEEEWMEEEDNAKEGDWAKENCIIVYEQCTF